MASDDKELSVNIFEGAKEFVNGAEFRVVARDVSVMAPMKSTVEKCIHIDASMINTRC